MLGDETHAVGKGTCPAVIIGSIAPEFTARTTMGQRALPDYRGRWLLLFSHPADFTPVCTSEFVSFSKQFHRFQDLNCDLLALSVDSLSSHVAWVRSINERFGVTVPFPIAEDPSMAVARAYGMLLPGAQDSSTVRATFVIDPVGVVRAISWYPMNVGRSVAEILRLVEALQVSDSGTVLTPEGWKRGEPVLDATQVSLEDAIAHRPSEQAPDWYFRLQKRSDR